MTTTQEKFIDCLRQNYAYLNHHYHVKKIGLFGSLAMETATENSEEIDGCASKGCGFGQVRHCLPPRLNPWNVGSVVIQRRINTARCPMVINAISAPTASKHSAQASMPSTTIATSAQSKSTKCYKLPVKVSVCEAAAVSVDWLITP